MESKVIDIGGPTELSNFCVRDFSKEAAGKYGEKKPIPNGPWGAEEGEYWSFNRDGDAVIKRIVVYSGSIVESLTFEYEFEGDDDKAKFGGHGGNLSGQVDLDFPEEYLTGISGTYRQLDQSRGKAISSLKFVTNFSEYGPFGNEEGSHFKLPLEGGMILGFHGWMNDHINAIGVYLKPA